ncbi:MAG: ATP-binding protein [Pseudomonadota bacterium]
MIGHLRTLSIRTKLIWMVLALLVIPWMGYQYVQEMQRFLLQGQQDALLLTANGIATVLNDRSELFNPETGVPEVLGDKNDLYAHQLDSLIQLDGQLADWQSLDEKLAYHTGQESFLCTEVYDPESFSLAHTLGYFERYLYAMFEVNDENLVYRDLDRRQLDTSDQIRMLLQLPDNTLAHYLLVARAPGRMSIYLVDEEWKLPLKGDPVTAFTAEMAETDFGYRVELRLPRDVIGTRTRIGFFAVDVDDAESREVAGILSTSPVASGDRPGQILLSSPELNKILKGLDRPRSRIWILDKQQRVRAVVGGLSAPLLTDAESEDAVTVIPAILKHVRELIDGLLKRPSETFVDVPTDVTHRPDKIFTTILKGEPKAEARPSLDQKAQIVVAGYPIRAGEQVLGAVIVEQSSNVILSLQYQLLRSLTLVTILVFGFVLLMLLIFAWRLTSRIRRLLTTTDRAITAEGRVLESRIPNRKYAADELGDLGRSITSMLKRLSGYTRYLEGMPDTLAHEMNNPLNVVSSSLEILEADQPMIRQNKYMQRARNGVDRLRAILTNLTEAANLEEAMRDEVKSPLDLSTLVSEFVEGYQSSHPEYNFILQVEAERLMVEGSEDHIAQMLDKLIDNAMQFSRVGNSIVVRLSSFIDRAEISVLNEGPELPEGIKDRLFDPMVSYGKTNAKHSHLGLGLFVVRLITEYHQGQVWADNRTDKKGVCITVAMPLFQTVSMN